MLNGKVLLVEDNEDAGEVLSFLIEGAKYHIRWVKSREDAIEAMRRETYEFLVLDYSMPGMQMEEFLRLCSGPCKIILVSAISDIEEQAKRLGIKHWLKKPYDPDKFLAMLKK